MAAGKTGRDRSANEAKERARAYQARQELHAEQARRRKRDTWLAAVVGGVVILGAVGGQVAYYSVGPGTPPPAPSPSPTSSLTPTPAPSTDVTPEPSPSATP